MIDVNAARTRRIAGRSLTIAFGLLLLLLLADLTRIAAGEPVAAGEESAEAVAPAINPRAAADADGRDWERLAENNLFVADRREFAEEPPPEPEVIPEPEPIPPPAFSFVGAIISGEDRQVLLKVPEGRGEKMLTAKPGDEVKGYRVKKIEPERVTVERDDKSFVVERGSAPAAPASSGRSTGRGRPPAAIWPEAEPETTPKAKAPAADNPLGVEIPEGYEIWETPMGRTLRPKSEKPVRKNRKDDKGNLITPFGPRPTAPSEGGKGAN